MLISAKVDRFFNRFHRFPEEEEMELSEGEWDEISADAEQMGRTLARRRYQQRRWPQGPPVKHAMRWGQACQSSVVS